MEVGLVTDVLSHFLYREKWDKVRNLIMTGNLGQQRHAEWVRKGRRFIYVLAIARETTAIALE